MHIVQNIVIRMRSKSRVIPLFSVVGDSHVDKKCIDQHKNDTEVARWEGRWLCYG